MGMTDFVIEREENFFGVAQDVAHEFGSFQEFYNKMMTQKDLVDHMEPETIVEYLSEIYFG